MSTFPEPVSEKMLRREAYFKAYKDTSEGTEYSDVLEPVYQGIEAVASHARKEAQMEMQKILSTSGKSGLQRLDKALAFLTSELAKGII